MRTLTEVFAPGAPSLPEGLRTLVVSPERTVEPGTTVRATFAFYNMGGAPATGLRVRFSLPEGLRYLPGSARIDDVALEEVRGETPLLATNGADIGEVPPGVERRIAMSYLVAPAIENGAVIPVQAALASVEVGVIGSNVVRLVAQSAPELQSPATFATIEALRDPAPGEEVRVVGRVHNSGQSSAHDVVVVLPVPDWTSYVPGSARIDGREVDVDERGDPFGFAHAPIALPMLAPGATLQVEYRARIAFPLDNGTRLYVHGAVASAETPEFELSRAELVVRAAARFEGGSSFLEIDAENEVEPGRRLRVALVAANSGTCAAEDVAVRLTLPGGVRYAPGSRAIDGRSLGEARESGDFVFERIPAGGRVEASLEAYVVSPALDGTQLTIGGHLAWSTGTRSFERTLTIRSAPRFVGERNTIEVVGSTTVVPGSLVQFAVHLANDGTTSATDAQLLLTADAALEKLRYTTAGGGTETRVHNGLVDLGAIEPGEARDLALVATLASPLGDRSEIRVAAVLDTREIGQVPLGSITLTARSRPRFTPAKSAITILSQDPLRPDRAGDILIAVENEGTDIARDVRVALVLSSDARIESVEGATRDAATVIFGDVEAGERAEARVRVRLARFVARGSMVSVEGRLSGVGLLPFLLDPVAIPTLAEPAFAQGASLRTQPADAVDAGEPMYFQLVLRNTGDGTASRLTVAATPALHTAYVPGTTTINEVPLLDVAGTSVLWSTDGLVLEEVVPGTEIVVRWCAIVNTPLPAGTLIEAEAEALWDGGGETTVTAPPVRVRSIPAFAVRALGLPFSVAGVAPLVRDTGRAPVIPEPPASMPPGFAHGIPRALPVPHDRTIEAPITITPSDIDDATWRQAPAEARISEPPARTHEMELAESRATAAARAAEEAQRLAEEAMRAAAEARSAAALRAAESRRIEETRAFEEAQRLEDARREHEERLLEAARRADDDARLAAEMQRLEAERRAEAERRLEAERLAEEMRRLDEERRAEDAVRRAEEEARRAAEDARRAEEEARRSEEMRRLEEERRLEAERRQEAERRIEEIRQRAEARRLEEEQRRSDEQRALEEQRRLEEERRAEELRRLEEEHRADQARLAEELRQAEAERHAGDLARLEEAHRAEQARLAEELRQAEAARRAEELARLEEQHRAEHARLAEERRLEEERRAEELRRIDAERAAEAARLAEERRVEEERRAEELRRLEEQHRADQARLAEELRLAEAERRAEELRRLEETYRAEQARLAEERRLEEERRAEERRLEDERRAEELRRLEEAHRAEQQRLAEERRAEDERRAAELAHLEEEHRADQARLAEELRQAEADRRAEELRQLAEAHQAEQARLVEERRLEEERRAEERRLEEEHRAEERRLEEERRAEERRVEDERRLEERRAEEARRAEEFRQFEEQQASERARLAEEAARLAEEARSAEAARLAAESRAAEEARLAAEARTTLEAAVAEARAAAEAAAEQARNAEAARASEEARAAAEASAATEARLALEAAIAEARATAESAVAQARAAEAARAAEEARAASESRSAEEARAALERAVAEARASEEARAREEARAAEAASLAAEARSAAHTALEEARLAAEDRALEQARAQAQAQAAAEAKAAADAAAAEARAAAQARAAEEARAHSEAAAAAEAKAAASAAAAEAQAAEARAQEAAEREAHLVEQARAAEDARRLAVEAREAAEARAAEESRAAAEARATAQERSIAAAAAAADRAAAETRAAEEIRAVEERAAADARAAEARVAVARAAEERATAEMRAAEERAAADVRAAQERAAAAAAMVPLEAMPGEALSTETVGILSFPPDKLERTLRFIEQADYGGLITHLFVVRSLVPETIAGVTAPDLQARIDNQRNALRNVVDRLFIKMRLPRYSLTAKDLEDRASRDALIELGRAIGSARPAVPAPPRSGMRIVGVIDRSAITTRLTSLEADPLGAATPWAVMAQLVGTSFEWDEGTSSILGDYRRSLIAALTSVSALPMNEFHRVLTSSSNAGLDEQLNEVKAVLRSALDSVATVADRG